MLNEWKSAVLRDFLFSVIMSQKQWGGLQKDINLTSLSENLFNGRATCNLAN